MAMTGGKSYLLTQGTPPNWPGPVSLYLYVKEKSQSIENNQTVISLGMYVTTPHEWGIGPWTDWNGSYIGMSAGGSDCYFFDGKIPSYMYGTRWIVENIDYTITHNPDGTKAVTIFYKWGVNSGWTGVMASPEGSVTINLTTVPRPSELALSTLSPVMTEDLTIYMNRHSSDFTHTIRYRFASAEGTVASNVANSVTWKIPDLAWYCSNFTEDILTLTCSTYNGGTKVGDTEISVTLRVPDKTIPSLPDGNVVLGRGNRVVATPKSSNFRMTFFLEFPLGREPEVIANDVTGEFSWTPPYDLASRIPNAATGEGRLVCVTYNGIASVGNHSMTINLIVPDNEETRPRFEADGLTLTPVGGLPSPFDQFFIVGLTKLRADFTASAQYSSITSYTLSAAGLTATGNPCVIDHLSVSGDISVRATVTDSRGFSTTVNKTITVVPYEIPKVIPAPGQSDIVCERCLWDGTPDPAGTYLLIKAGRKYSPIQNNNFCTLRFQHKASSADGFGEWITLLSDSDSENDVTHIDSNATPHATVSYNIRLSVIDTVGNETVVEVYIPTDDVAFHLKAGGKGAAFGKYAEEDGLLDLAWGLRAAGGIAPIGSYDGKDLNAMIEKGGCFSGGTPSVYGTSNCPEDAVGLLMVLAADGIAVQMFYAGSGNVYSRVYSGSFTAWKSL